MLYTPHFLVGAAIVKLVPNPYIGLPLALASHFLLDVTPHNDFDLKPGITLKEFLAFPKKRLYFIVGALLVDFLLMILALFWILFGLKNHLSVYGGVMGILPDAIEQSLMLFGVALPGWQDKLQWRVSAKYGFISYPIFSLMAIWVLLI